MADDDQKSRSGENEDVAQFAVPSHDPLPLPPEVQYSRPSAGRRPGSVQRGGSNEYGSQSHDVSAPVKYTNGLAGGLTLASSILAGYWLGAQIDARWVHGTTPWATIVMILAGTFVGFYNMFRLLNRSDSGKK